MATFDRNDVEDKIDDAHAFEIQSLACGTTYDNRSHSCPSCGSGDCSYGNDDAKRWNDRPRVR